MKLGIVGHEAAKFTPDTEAECKMWISRLIRWNGAKEVISGACHLGGVDVWAIEIAKEFGVAYREFPPATRSWTDGYKPRNIEIAKASDVVICLVVDKLPSGYKGKRYPYCYHCKPTNDTFEHIKSGGCWTVKYAVSIGKKGSYVKIIRDLSK